MGDFLLARNRASGELSLISTKVFESRTQALEALSSISASPEFPHRNSDLFVVDLSSATPILMVVPSVAPTAAAEEPEPDSESSAGVWEAPLPYEESDAVLDEILAEAEYESATPQEAEPDVPSAEGDSVTEALKRATGSLESEGVRAPASVVAEPDPWPWESEASTPAIDRLEEPAVDAEPLLPAVAPDEELFVPRPVIMGDYAPESRDQVVPEALDEVSTWVEEQQPDAEGAGLAQRRDEQPVSVLADLTIVTPEGAHQDDIPPMTPTLDAASCDDCVYVVTCPNKEERTPADCGNFQWRHR